MNHFNGIAIGTVEDLSLAPQDPRRVIALVKLQADAPVKVDTRAKISMTGLTGSPFIQLTGGSPEAPRLTASSKARVDIRGISGGFAFRVRIREGGLLCGNLKSFFFQKTFEKFIRSKKLQFPEIHF